MGLYDAMLKEQLKEEAGRRGLPVGGTNEELVARLEAHDLENDPLLEAAAKENGADTASKPSPAPSTAPTPPSVVPTAAVAPEATEEPEEGPFRTRFRCDGELSTGVHQENQQRTWEQAFNAGLRPRGGAFGAYRVGFEVDGGARYAVYEINVRR